MSVASNAKKMQETIGFYKTTKLGVDTTDQMARKYFIKTVSRPWSDQGFCNVLSKLELYAENLPVKSVGR